MQGASRVALTELKGFLDAQYKDASASDLEASGDTLLSLVPILDDQRPLRTALADSSISAEAKTGIIDQLLGEKASTLALSTLKNVASTRWSRDSDFVDAVEVSGVSLVLMSAEKDGHLGEVEEEVFRFGRSIDANADLQMALTNPATPAAAKAGIVTTLLKGKALDETTKIIGHGVETLRGRRVQDVVADLSKLAAERRGQAIAEVRSAIELSEAQRTRLAAALGKIHGREVELNVVVDPAVVGGLQVLIGDELIDGTAISKLEQARRRIVG